MRFFTLILLLANAAYASGLDTDMVFMPLAFVVVLLFGFIFVQKLKLRTKKQDIIEILESEELNNIYRDKTAVNFDLQEIFLYFFKTLAYEAGVNNNVFLVRQNMSVTTQKEPAPRPNNPSIADTIRPNFLEQTSTNTINTTDNLSQKITDPNREIMRPIRHFFGDYTDVVNGIHSCIDLISAGFSNKTFAIDIDQLSGPDSQILLSIEVSICEPQNKEIAKLFANLTNPQDLESVERITQFQSAINKIPGAKYYIKDSSNRINYTIALSIPLIVSDHELPYEVAPKYILKALVIHENRDIAKTLINNLNDFNIECIYNQSDSSLLKNVLAGVNFPYRAVLLDADVFNSMNISEQDKLLESRLDNRFELVLVLNNQKAAQKIRAEIASDLTYLPLPYTVDNIRAIVNLITNQHESLLK